MALNWFRSYLTNRSYAVMYGSNFSDVVQLVCSVPQGSILGPLLFLLYTAELEDVAAGMGVSIHMYVDDTQLYVHCKPSGMIDAVARLEQCIDRVDKWMAASRLKLNSDKSEVIWVGSARTLQKHPGPEVTVSTSVTEASDKVQLLGVGISADVTLDQHVMKIAGQCFYQLRQLRSVRRSLNTDSIKTLIRAFVSS